MKMKIYTLGLMLLMAGSTFAQKSNAVATKVSVAPVIDGTLSEYALTNMVAKSIAIPQNLECGYTTSGPAINNTTSFGVAWDAENLYIGVRVIDAAVIAEDMVELFFSMKNEETTNCPGNWPKAYTSSEYQYQVSKLTATGTPTITSPQGAEPAIVASKVVKTAEGYDLEIQFLLSELDFFIDPKPVNANRVIGFDLFNVDYDVAATRAGHISWNACCSDRNWTESKNFGTVTLSDVTSTKDINSIVSTLSVYPNPANTDKVSVELNALSSETATISVVSSLSKTVYNKNVTFVPGQNNFELSTNGWSDGVYYILVSNGKSNKTQKLVITK
ncbi:MAG TPA: sugar-binding protein [Cytophagaceae bacterium]|jgi:hypothetical protein